MFSHLEQRHGFLEHKVSHVELRPNSHRRQGLTESKASQRVQHYEQRQGLREGRVSQKARPHRSQGLTEGKASQKPGSHGRPGLAEGKTLEKARCVTHSRDSHNRQGETMDSAPEGVFTREITRSRTVALLYCSHTRTALAHFLVGGRMTGPALDILP